MRLSWVSTSLWRIATSRIACKLRCNLNELVPNGRIGLSSLILHKSGRCCFKTRRSQGVDYGHEQKPQLLTKGQMARQNGRTVDLVGHSQVAEDSLAVGSNLAEAAIGRAGTGHLEGSCAGPQCCALCCSTGPSHPCHPWEVHWVEVVHQHQDTQVGVETAIA